MRYKPGKTHGFTLVEVIVSLTLLGFIFLLLFSGLYTANKSWIAGEKKIAQNDEIRLAAVFLRRQLTQALPIMWINQKEQNLLFHGKENELSFVSTLPAHRGGGGLTLITLRTNQNDEDESDLIIEYQQINAETDSYKNSNDEVSQNKAVLISHVKNIELSYFGSDQINDSPLWHDEWTDKKVFPELIRININSSVPDMTWPQIEVALPVNFITGQPQFTIVSENEFPLS